MPELVLFRLVPFGYIIIASSSQDFNSAGVRRTIGKLIHLGLFAFSEPVPAHRAQERDHHQRYLASIQDKEVLESELKTGVLREAVASVFLLFSLVVVDCEGQHCL